MKIYGKLEIGSKLENVKESTASLIETARVWERMGAAGLYVKYTSNCRYEVGQYFDTLEQLVKAVRLPVIIEVNGGSRQEVESILALGADSIVIGEAAVLDELLINELLSVGKGRISVLLDSCNGAVSSRSWVNIGEFSAYNFVGKLAEKGCRNVVFSDKDAKCITGDSYDMLEKLCSIGRVRITLAGWLSSAEELLRLKNSGIDGFIMESPDILRSY